MQNTVIQNKAFRRWIRQLSETAQPVGAKSQKKVSTSCCARKTARRTESARDLSVPSRSNVCRAAAAETAKAVVSAARRRR